MLLLLGVFDEAGSEFDVQVDGFEEFFFCDFFVRRVGDVDGAGAEQEGFAPGGERGYVGGELRDHGGKVADLAHADEGELEAEVYVGAVPHGSDDGPLDFVGRAYEADKEVGLGFVGDDVGRATTFDEADVQGGWTDVGFDRMRHRHDVVERGDEFVD